MRKEQQQPIADTRQAGGSKARRQCFLAPDVLLSITLGSAGLIAMLIIAAIYPNPSDFQQRIYVVFLALSAAAFAAAIPGMLQVALSLTGIVLRAAGALAVFVLVYFNDPIQVSLSRPVRISLSTPASPVLPASRPSSDSVRPPEGATVCSRPSPRGCTRCEIRFAVLNVNVGNPQYMECRDMAAGALTAQVSSLLGVGVQCSGGQCASVRGFITLDSRSQPLANYVFGENADAPGPGNWLMRTASERVRISQPLTGNSPDRGSIKIRFGATYAHSYTSPSNAEPTSMKFGDFVGHLIVSP